MCSSKKIEEVQNASQEPIKNLMTYIRTKIEDLQKDEEIRGIIKIGK